MSLLERDVPLNISGGSNRSPTPPQPPHPSDLGFQPIWDAINDLPFPFERGEPEQE